MNEDLKEFHEEFFQDVLREADAGGRFAEDAFFELFCEQLVDAGELETADRARYVGVRGVRIDGFGGDPALSDGVLSLIIADFQQDEEIGTLTATEMDAIFKRGTAFVNRALDRQFRNSLEETSQGFALADLIAQSWRSVSRVRLFLISNRVLSSRVDGRAAGEIDGIPITYSVWDLGRLHRFATSGRTREEIVVDLDEHGGPIPALPAHLSGVGYKAFLLVMPGAQLASIYDRWGARLLEQNVRVFLQARGGVNKGIRATLEQDPEMFFAYNNGITATAEDISTRRTADGMLITRLKNLQIVNGGQTTASVFAASRAKKDLSKVFIQVKLSIIPPARAEEVVPKISEYANSQNKVNAADFFSNHPFHTRMKTFSERLFAPSRDGTFRESKWFYERARGQYQDARANLTVAERRKFDLQYPKSQLFDKTKVAKAINVWRERPHIVSKGSQKNFADFAEYIGKAWQESPDTFNEAYYRHLVAKVIVFGQTEKIVSSEPWYEGSYRANIVAYAIAKLAHDVSAMGRAVDFERIWRDQDLSPPLREALRRSAASVKDVIVAPDAGQVRNVTEWAKQPLCWTRVAALRVDWPVELESALVTYEEQKANARSAIKEQRVLNGIEAQGAVVRAGAAFWKQVREWAVANRILSVQELEALAVAGRVPQIVPNERQSLLVVGAFAKVRAEGCPLDSDALLS